MAQGNLRAESPSTSSGKGTIPTATQITGTITSSEVRVTGTGTLFKSELSPGDFIYNTDAAANPAVRKVTHVLDDTHLILESAFPVDVSGINLYRVRGKYKSVGVANLGGAAGVLNEGTIMNGAAPFYEAKDGYVVDPMSFNATGTEFNIFTSTM